MRFLSVIQATTSFPDILLTGERRNTKTGHRMDGDVCFHQPDSKGS